MTPQTIVAGMIAAILGIAALDNAAAGAQTEVSEPERRVPERLSPLLQAFSARPPSRVFLGLTQEDRPTLTALYKQAAVPADRRGLTWGLAYVGNNDSAQLLMGSLLDDYAGKPLSGDDEDVLFDTVLALGFLAARDDAASSFVRAGVEPSSWKTRKKWSSKRGDFAIDLLVSYSIQAIGISGRSDVPHVLQSLRGKDANYLHRFASGVTQAVFYYEMQKQHGREFLKENFVTSDKHESLFDKWIRTPSGADWYEWANECMRGPRPAPEKEER